MMNDKNFRDEVVLALIAGGQPFTIETIYMEASKIVVERNRVIKQESMAKAERLTQLQEQRERSEAEQTSQQSTKSPVAKSDA